MIQVNVFEVKAKLSEYLERAGRGERIVICRHNKPVAELRAIEQTRVEPRPIGPLPGERRFDLPASFFEPLSDDELDLWEGGGGPQSVNRPSSSDGTSKRTARSRNGTVAVAKKKTRAAGRRSRRGARSRP